MPTDDSRYAMFDQVPEIPLRVKFEGHHLVAAHPEDCEPHTPAPASPLRWLEWFEQVKESHVQRQCRGCGLRAVWEPNPGP